MLLIIIPVGYMNSPTSSPTYGRSQDSSHASPGLRLNVAVSFRKEMQELKSEVKKIVDHERRLLEQSQIITEQTRKIAEQDHLFVQMNRRMVENEKKLKNLRRICVRKIIRNSSVDSLDRSTVVRGRDPVNEETMITEQCTELVRTNEAVKRTVMCQKIQTAKKKRKI